MPTVSADWVYEINDDGTVDHYLLAPKGGRSNVPVMSTDSNGNTVLVGVDGKTAFVDGKHAQLDGSASIWDTEVVSGDIGSGRYLDIPSPYYFGDAVADRDGWATSQTTVGAGNLTLTGVQPSIPLELTLYSTGNLSGVTFTVTGVDMLGKSRTEAITGPNNTTKYGSVPWASISQIAVSGAVGTAVEVGWASSADSVSVIHPSPVYVPEGWNGYKYWLAFTPYRGSFSQCENPSVVASNDFVNWEAPATNPIIQPPDGLTAYLSDCHLYMLPDKSKLLMMYRDSGVVSGKDQLLVTETTDGVNWTTPVVIWSFANTAGNPRLTSPSFFHDGTNWVIYAHDSNDAGYALKRMARAGDYASIYTSWSALTPVAVTMVNPRGETWWHSHLICLSTGRIIGVASDNDSAAGYMWLLQSDDGTTFYVKATPFTRNIFYRNGIHVEADNTGQAEKIVITTSLVDTLTRPTYTFARVTYSLNGKVAGRQNAILAANDVYSISGNDRKSLILAADVFTGTAATNVGTSSDGKTWVQYDTNNVQYDGSGKAMNENTSNCIAWIDTAQADYSAQMTFSSRNSTGQAFLLFRLVDGENRWRFGCSSSGGEYDLQSIVSSAVVDNIRITGYTQADGDILRVECDGSRIQAYINGVMVYALNSTTHLNGTKCGLQLRHPTGGQYVLVDDFLVHKLS